MRIIESGISEIGYKPEEIPQWFQDLLDELFDGAGVPKEYMAHVRVRHLGNRAKWATLRFLLSKKGANYMYPPWWIWRENTGWAWVPSKNTDFHPAEHIDISVPIQPGETLRIASAPYEEPSVVCEKARQLSEQYDIWTYREIGHSAQGRPICVLETQPRDLTLLVDIEPLKNRKVLIDPRQPEHNVYGDKHICEQAGTIRTFLQAIPDSIDAHNADVKEMVETVAHALIEWRETGAS